MAQQTLQVAMYLDEELYEQYTQNKWNEQFGESGIPMTPATPGERAALRKFARTARKNSGASAMPPTWLLKGELPAADALGHILRDEMEVIHYRQRSKHLQTSYQIWWLLQLPNRLLHGVAAAAAEHSTVWGGCCSCRT